MTRRGRTIMALVAAGLLIAALIWNASINRRDPLRDIAEEINAHGYSLTAEDIYVLGGQENANIAQVMGESAQAVAEAAEAGKSAGFPSDTQTAGDVTVLLANVERGVITIYLLNGEIELCFIQTAGGEVEPL